jgi:hypothetical protein
MPRHTDPLISFDVPRDWENRTIIAFAAPEQNGKGAANIVVTRDRLADDEELIDYAERHIDELEETMEGFFLLSSVEESVGGKTAYTMTFESDGPEGPLAQRLTMVELTDRVVVAVTLTAPERELDQLGPLFDHMIDSIEWGSPS